MNAQEMSRHAYSILQTVHNIGIYYSLQMVYILRKKKKKKVCYECISQQM